jgi:hypothetical protein
MSQPLTQVKFGLKNPSFTWHLLGDFLDMRLGLHMTPTDGNMQGLNLLSQKFCCLGSTDMVFPKPPKLLWPGLIGQSGCSVSISIMKILPSSEPITGTLQSAVSRNLVNSYSVSSQRID